MNQKFSAYVLFYLLGLVFWLLSMSVDETTLLCVFYSIFVGTVWGLIPKVSGTEPLNWKFLLPPFMLVTLMMFSVKLRMVMSSEVVLITAMALLHLRAFILSLTRLNGRARIFTWVQLATFVFGILYLFQKNILSFVIPRSIFLMFMMGLSTLSIALLITVKGKQHVSSPEETNDDVSKNHLK